MKLAITPLVLSTATFGLMLVVAENAQAFDLIPKVTVQTTMGTQPGFDIVNTVNGAGLVPNSVGPLHVASQLNTNNSTFWQAGGITGSITFGFGRVYNLVGFNFWNLNGPGQTRFRGINGVQIQYSTDGTNFFNIAGAPTNFNQGVETLVARLPQEVNFAPVRASHVKFNVQSNFGGGQVRSGFAEIQFKSIPEPSSTLALLALGLAGIGLRKRI